MKFDMSNYYMIEHMAVIVKGDKCYKGLEKKFVTLDAEYQLTISNIGVGTYLEMKICRGGSIFFKVVANNRLSFVEAYKGGLVCTRNIHDALRTGSEVEKILEEVMNT
uniref:Uncharacterized protein n=1 Tax=viral metagenome TaxID=1070528 RepID=A0A6H1ZMX9_9ZZZZ